MDPSGVLLALEEQKKWRERQKRIEERIKQLDRRKAYLLRELEHARRKTAEASVLATGLRDSLRTKGQTTPTILQPR